MAAKGVYRAKPEFFNNISGQRPFPTRVAHDALRQKRTIGGLKILRHVDHHETRREPLGLRIWSAIMGSMRAGMAR